MRFVPMDNRNLNFLYGYALSREAGKLVDAYNPKKLIRTVSLNQHSLRKEYRT